MKQITAKDVLKKAVFLLLYYGWFWTKKRANNLLVLTYHRVSEQPDLDDPLKVSVKTFEKQVLFLKRHYHILSAEQLADILENKQPFPERSCLITFDDGWKDNFTCAYPVLKKHGVPALIFLSTDYIGTTKVFWHDRLQWLLVRLIKESATEKVESVLKEWPSEVIEHFRRVFDSNTKTRYEEINGLIEALKKFDTQKIDQLNHKLHELLPQSIELPNEPVMLSWEEVEEMSQHNVCFGSHTKSHAILTQVSEESAWDELKDSKAVIENKLGKPVKHFSYPNGNFNDTLIKIANRTRYITAFTTMEGDNAPNDNPYTLRRRHILEDTSFGFNGSYSDIFFNIDISGVRHALKQLVTSF